MRDDKFDRDAHTLAKLIYFVLVACVLTILGGLSLTVPWLGIPLTVIVLIGWRLAN